MDPPAPMEQSILDCSAIHKRREDDDDLGSYDGMSHNETDLQSLHDEVDTYHQQQHNQTTPNEDAQTGHQAAGGATL